MYFFHKKTSKGLGNYTFFYFAWAHKQNTTKNAILKSNNMDITPQTHQKYFRNVGLEIVELSHYDGALSPLLDTLYAQVYPHDTVGTVLRIRPTLVLQGEGRDAVNASAKRLISTLDALITTLRGICMETSPAMPLTIADYVRHFMTFDPKLQPAGAFDSPSFNSLCDKIPEAMSAEKNVKLCQALMDALWILNKSKSAIDLKSLHCPGKSYIESMIKVRSAMNFDTYVPPTRAEGDRFNMMLCVARMLNNTPPKRVRLLPATPRAKKLPNPASIAAAAATPRRPPVALGVIAAKPAEEDDERDSQDDDGESDESEESVESDEIEDDVRVDNTFDDDANDGTITNRSPKRARLIEDDEEDTPVAASKGGYPEVVTVK